MRAAGLDSQIFGVRKFDRVISESYNKGGKKHWQKEKNKKSKTINQQSLEILKQMCLFDDTFATEVFDEYHDAAQTILEVVLKKKNVVVTDVYTQKTISNPFGRSVRLDIYAEEKDVAAYDIEIQRSNTDATIERACFNRSLMDMKMSKKGQKFKNLPSIYVIFITQNDIYGHGDPLYYWDMVLRGYENEFRSTRSQIIYVNGAYKGNDDIGKLVCDFWCSDPSQMHYDTLRNAVSHFKYSEEGVKHMCSVMRKFGLQKLQQGRKEGRKEGRAEERAATIPFLIKLVKQTMADRQLSGDDAIHYLEIPDKYVDEIEASLREENNRGLILDDKDFLIE